MNVTTLAAAAAVLAATLAVTPGTAHADATGVRVWYQPGDQFTSSMIWRFDFGSGTGYKRSAQPSLTGWALQRQTSFTFEKSGAEYTLHTFEYAGTQRITGLDYDRPADTWVVDNDGYTQQWYGCRSAGRPLSAVVAC